jgi:hypothetical protein
MAFRTPGESPLQDRQESRKVSPGHKDVAVIKEPTPQPGHTINLRGMPCGGNSGPNWRALASSKSRGPHTAKVRATLPTCSMVRTNPNVCRCGPSTGCHRRSCRSAANQVPGDSRGGASILRRAGGLCSGAEAGCPDPAARSARAASTYLSLAAGLV